MRRVIVGLLAAMLGVWVIAPVSALAASPSSGVPKVVLIVGPAGAATDRYRSEARAAASIARQYTPDVTEVFSPNATWPAVKDALQGASVVVYMGHGNGWPSPYRGALYPPSQNGFGLNPTAGSGDDTHQYFGEGRIAQSIRLAPNAVVLLNHLCYASGNSEPGLAEGTLSMAKQRVDNFAAGFVKAGASAVVAEAYDDPNHMLRAVLSGRGGIESAWRHAPSANDNTFGFESSRSPGYVAEMDPAHQRSGFTRSIVLKQGLASRDVLRSARGSTSAVTVPINPAVLVPSLMGTGLVLKTPVLRSTAAGRPLWYRIPYAISAPDRLPAGMEASVRWDPLDPPTTGSTADPTAPPDFGLVTPERLGDVVAPTALRMDPKSLSVRVNAPQTPGRYRLTVMLHDKDGVAYDAGTQAQLLPLIVRLTGPNDAAVSAPASLDLQPGEARGMNVWVTNLGSAAWGTKPVAGTAKGTNRKPVGAEPATHAQLVGTWVPLGVADERQVGAAAAASITPAELPAAFAPRAIGQANLNVFAPTAKGDYLLVIDIITPEVGSLAAQGVEPTIVRVHVAEPVPVATPTPAPTATPTPEPSPTPTPSTPQLPLQPED